jgi:hypothetical protein
MVLYCLPTGPTGLFANFWNAPAPLTCGQTISKPRDFKLKNVLLTLEKCITQKTKFISMKKINIRLFVTPHTFRRMTHAWL